MCISLPSIARKAAGWMDARLKGFPAISIASCLFYFFLQIIIITPIDCNIDLRRCQIFNDVIPLFNFFSLVEKLGEKKMKRENVCNPVAAIILYTIQIQSFLYIL